MLPRSRGGLRGAEICSVLARQPVQCGAITVAPEEVLNYLTPHFLISCCV